MPRPRKTPSFKAFSQEGPAESCRAALPLGHRLTPCAAVPAPAQGHPRDSPNYWGGGHRPGRRRRGSRGGARGGSVSWSPFSASSLAGAGPAEGGRAGWGSSPASTPSAAGCAGGGAATAGAIAGCAGGAAAGGASGGGSWSPGCLSQPWEGWRKRRNRRLLLRILQRSGKALLCRCLGQRRPRPLCGGGGSQRGPAQAGAVPAWPGQRG